MVTVVIPTYNSTQYIEKAINSVLEQTYKDIELIIVDDCSTDNTVKFIEDKFKDIPNLKIIRNKKNVGVGISRKIGINNANGEYITFLDSDDYLLKDFVQMNLALIKQHDSDMVYTSVGVLSPTYQFKPIEVGDYIAENEGTLTLFFNSQMNFLTGKLFKTDLVRNCQWSERRIAEDVQTLFYIMYEAKKVRSYPYVGYIHVCREGSLMGFDSAKMDEQENLNHSFHNFCYNCIAEKEMLEFLMAKNDTKILPQMYEAYFNKVKQTREFIKNKTLPKEIYKQNKHLWKIVDDFYPKE